MLSIWTRLIKILLFGKGLSIGRSNVQVASTCNVEGQMTVETIVPGGSCHTLKTYTWYWGCPLVTSINPLPDDKF